MTQHLRKIVSRLPDEYSLEDVLSATQSYFKFDYNDTCQVYNNLRQLCTTPMGKHLSSICVNYSYISTSLDDVDPLYEKSVRRLCQSWACFTGQNRNSTK